MRSMVVYGSFLDATKELEPEDFKKIWMSILQYGIDNQEPDVLQGVAKMAFELARPNIDANKKRRKPSFDNNCRQLQTIADNCEKIPQFSNDGDVDEDGDEDIKKKRTRMARPSMPQIREYCKERKNNVDAEQFFNFYEAKGWKVGNAPMKDWKAAVRTWERRKIYPSGRGSPNSMMTTHDYDFDVLERKISEAQRA